MLETQQATETLATIGLPRVGTVCDLMMDDDLKRVMEFMQCNMSASKLVGVAQAAAAMAPIIWGQYEREEVHALALQARSLNLDGSQPATAT
ncbi:MULTISPECIES: hypothetical protein [unclassified Massilia]|uniref:hypothetical protein n=1 Tax=unclassified Massilia TaxID=2609279 RepID=UPI00064B0D7F|nr:MULTISPECIES: hypothetical protein [unclassified Massilia]ALK96999.1 hypothetical protein AM586_12775 [Massilia sp. WG5]